MSYDVNECDVQEFIGEGYYLVSERFSQGKEAKQR